MLAQSSRAWCGRRWKPAIELPSQEIATWATTAGVRDAVLAAANNATPKMSGWVLHTLTGALWAVSGADSFDEAVWRAIELGVDADTVGAVAGAFAGAVWGLGAIPSGFSSRLQSRHPMFVGTYPQTLTMMADQLIDLRR